jgi:opacity protein-like surface antigen
MHRIVTTAVCALLAAAPVRAQDAAPDTIPRTSLQKGAWSLSFDPPVYGGLGTGSLGAWKMVGQRTNLGVSVRAHTRLTDSRSDSVTLGENSAGVELGLDARRYLAPAREVTPFATGGVFAFYAEYDQNFGTSVGERHLYGTGVSAGAGLEWFPVRRVSFAGHTGVRLNVNIGESAIRTGNGERNARERGLEFATFTSRLSLQVYF